MRLRRHQQQQQLHWQPTGDDDISWDRQAARILALPPLKSANDWMHNSVTGIRDEDDNAADEAGD